MLDIANLMLGLSTARPIFHSEADFQHAFAWQLHERLPDCQIRLEFNPLPAQKKGMYLDIWVQSLKVAIHEKAKIPYAKAGLGMGICVKS